MNIQMMHWFFWWAKKSMHFSIHSTGTQMNMITNLEWCTYFFDWQNIDAFFHPFNRHTDENDHKHWMMYWFFWLTKKSMHFSIQLAGTQMNMITNIKWCTYFFDWQKNDAFFHPFNRNTNQNDHKHWMMHWFFWCATKSVHFSIHLTETHMKMITNIEWCTYFFEGQFHPFNRNTNENNDKHQMMHWFFQLAKNQCIFPSI